jgi:type IV secretory pathway VirB3-like protein
MMPEPSRPGAVVHRSLLEPLLLAGVPYDAAMANLFHTFLVMVTFGVWGYWMVGLVVHGVLMLLCWDDPLRMRKCLRYLIYRRYYHPR